jgi:hypothetical protein
MGLILVLLCPILVSGLVFGHKQGKETFLTNFATEATADGEWQYAVIGLAAGRTYAMHSKQFVTSLRSTGYAGKIILGVDAPSARLLKDFYKEHDVTPNVLKDAHKCNDSGMGDNCANIQVGDTTGEAPINLARFHLYKEWTADLDEKTLIMVSGQ